MLRRIPSTECQRDGELVVTYRKTKGVRVGSGSTRAVISRQTQRVEKTSPNARVAIELEPIVSSPTSGPLDGFLLV